jgi:predicted transcriptional regulator
MQVLLSIHPGHAQAILDGRKRYEFRKRRFSRRGVGKVYLYSTAPVGRIVGSLTVGEVHEGAPTTLWRRFGRSSGLTREEFLQYYRGCRKGYAMEVVEPRPFRRPVDPRRRYVGFRAPRDFCYTDRLVRRRSRRNRGP